MTGTTFTEATSAGAVAGLTVARGAVDLDELREVAAVAQRGCNRGARRREAVRGDLKTLPGCSVAHAFDEGIRGRLVPLAHGDVEYQLGVALNRHERVAVAKVLVVLRSDAFLFFSDEAPNRKAVQARWGKVNRDV